MDTSIVLGFKIKLHSHQVISLSVSSLFSVTYFIDNVMLYSSNSHFLLLDLCISYMETYTHSFAQAETEVLVQYCFSVHPLIKR